MIATIGSHRFGDIVPQMAELLDETSTNFCDECTLRIPAAKGTGFVRGIDFEHGLGVSEWNVTIAEETAITFDCSRSNPVILLLFVLDGEADVEYGYRTSSHVGPLEGLLVAPDRGARVVLRWPAGRRMHFNLVTIGRQELLGQIDCYLFTAPDALAQLFRDIEGKSRFVYRAPFGIGLAEAVNGINRSSLAGVANTLHLRAKGWDVLAQMIRQYFDHSDEKRQTYRTSLGKRDIDTLHEARAQLVADLKSPPTIEELAERVGINRTKLQSGFRALFGTTVNRYLRDTRLREAKMLLTEDRLPIVVIAETVGYANASQFARRFSEKYGMLPSEYLAVVRQG